MKPGESGYARLKLDDPLLLFPGDRFIIRQFSPVITIGGGQVLDVIEPSRRMKAAERLAFVQRIARRNSGAGVAGAGGAARRCRIVDGRGRG